MGNLETREIALKKLARKINNGERILDLATGSGYLVRNLIDKDVFVVCLDIDSRPLIKTKKELSDLNYVCADASHLPFKNSSFDSVVTWSALVHIKDWKKVIGESFRVSSKVTTAEPKGEFQVRAFKDFNCKHAHPEIEEIQREFEKHARTYIDDMDFISLISSRD